MKKAFSIIELIIVLVVLVVISVSINISLGPAGVQVLDVGVRRVVSDIRYVQSLAMNKKDWYGIRFNDASSGSSYYAYNGKSSGWGVPPLDYNPAKFGAPYQIYLDQLYKKVNIVDVEYRGAFFWIDADYLLFDSKGRPCSSLGDPRTSDTRIKVVFDPGGCGSSSPFSKWIYVAPGSGRITLIDA